MRRYTKFPSVKLNKIVVCQSPVERDYAFLLERDIGVKFYKEQPLRIYYWHDGKRHRYTPDFLVHRESKKQIVEVKPAIQVIKEKYQILFKSIAQICRREGYEFVVVTDTMIRVQPRLNNTKKLYRYAKVPLSPQHQILSKRLLETTGEISIVELARLFTNEGHENSVSVVYAMCYWGLLKIDLMQPIVPSSLVTLPL